MARQAKCSKVYVLPNGDESRHARPGAHIEFRWADGHVDVVRPSDFPEDIQACAVLHGLAQKLGDSYASTSSIQDAQSAFTEAYEQLGEGDWVTVREGGGPRVTQLAEAYRRAKAARGETVSLEDAARTVASWDSDKRKAVSDIPEIAYQLAQIRLEAAQKKAEEAKAAAAAGNGEGLSLEDV